MSFIKRLIEDFTAPLEAAMTKTPTGQGGLGVRVSRHIAREYLAGRAQRRGYMAAQK